jgi:ZIP family zinc transporter
VLELVIAATLTAVATGLGAIPVIVLGERAAGLTAAMLGFAGGVMVVAAVAGLLLPASAEGGPLEVSAGFAAGVAFLLVMRRLIGDPRRGRVMSASERSSILVFAVLLVHSLPEGFAIGTAYASATEGLGLFVVVAIAIQNIPEGTSIAIPMAAAGIGPLRQILAAIASSLPQPVGAVIAFLLVEQIEGLLPISFAFAAGAMVALAALELLPSALRAGRRDAVIGALLGLGSMALLSALVGI